MTTRTKARTNDPQELEQQQKAKQKRVSELRREIRKRERQLAKLKAEAANAKAAGNDAAVKAALVELRTAQDELEITRGSIESLKAEIRQLGEEAERAEASGFLEVWAAEFRSLSETYEPDVAELEKLRERFAELAKKLLWSRHRQAQLAIFARCLSEATGAEAPDLGEGIQPQNLDADQRIIEAVRWRPVWPPEFVHSPWSQIPAENFVPAEVRHLVEGRGVKV